MMTQQGKLNNGEELDYASGLLIRNYKGLMKVSNGGGFVGFRAQFIRFPEHKFSVAIFANRKDANPSQMAYKVIDIFLSDKFVVENKLEKEEGLEVSNNDELSYDQLIGTYEVTLGEDITVSIEDEKLHAKQHWNNEEYNLIRDVRIRPPC